MIHVRPGAYLLAAGLILLIPARWLVGMALASALHELGHLAVIYGMGGKADSIVIGASGAQIHTRIQGNGREFLCAAAGPAVSLLLMSAGRLFPELSVCAGIQGIFNLLPVYPMDGGRMVLCLCRFLFAESGDRVFRILEGILLLGLLFLAPVFWRRFGLLAFIACIAMVFRLVCGKIPCKSANSAVQ